MTPEAQGNRIDGCLASRRSAREGEADDAEEEEK